MGTERGEAARGDARCGSARRVAELEAEVAALRRADAELAAGRAALRQREERLRLLLDSATGYAIVGMDLDRRVTSWNAGAERLTGWTEAEAVGRLADLIFTPEDRAAGAPQREAAGALRDGRAANERWHLRKDGSRFWGSGLVMPLRDPGPDPAGAPVGLLKVLRDETGRKRDAEALLARERRLRLLSGMAAGLLAAADPDEVLAPVFRALADDFGLGLSLSYVLDGGGDGSDGGGMLRLASCFGVPGEARAGFERLALGEKVCGVAALERRMVHVANVQEGKAPGCADIAALGVRAYAAFPLLAAGGRLLGTLSFGARDRDRFADGDLGFLGAIAHLVAAVRERLRGEAALRGSEARFRLMADAAPQIVWVTDAEGRNEFYNEQWFAYTGAPRRGRTTAAETAARFLHPDDAAPTMERFEQARRTGGAFVVEHRIRSKDGAYRWFLVRGEPHRDPRSGEIARWFGASVDIHDRKLAEEARALLMNELNHRVKNTLAVVQSLALQTARGAADLPSFTSAFQARLMALARAHDLLTREGWRGAPLGAAVRAAVDPLAAGRARVDLSGCAAGGVLAPAVALALSLALHELATNALKHGALSVPGGGVSVACRADPAAGGAWVVEWSERGGPQVAGPPARRGFGLRLLERGLASQAGLRADLRFEPGGVRCFLRLPPSPGGAADDGLGAPAPPV